MAGYSNKTGLIYHQDMLRHRCTWDDNHIEIPARLSRSYEKCRELGLVDRCLELEPALATESDILLYHNEKLLRMFSKCDKLNEDKLGEICQKFDDVFLCPHSFHAALLSAGCTIQAARAIIENRCRHSMALVRPPGHHAMADESNGFCMFNNVVIAAKKMLQEHGLNKIAIVDWDVHHGQGTQRAFYDSAQVLYISMHRYEYGLFWPNLRESDWDRVGECQGAGYNVNLPLNKTGLGDAEYISMFCRIILPILAEFQPELILVSAGYDGAIGCPEGHMLVSPACYGHMTRMLTAIGPVCAVLEGGYCLESLEESVAITLSALLGDPCPQIQPLVASHVDRVVTDVILNATHLLSRFWSCFRTAIDFLPPFEPKSTSMLNYFGNLIKPEKYPTKNKYKPRCQKEILHFQEEIRKLVELYDANSLRGHKNLAVGLTDLENRSEKQDLNLLKLIFGTLENYSIEHYRIFLNKSVNDVELIEKHKTKLNVHDNAKDADMNDFFFQIINDIIDSKIRNGLVIAKSSNDNLLKELIKHASHRHSPIKGILLLDISSSEIFIHEGDLKNYAGEILYIKADQCHTSEFKKFGNVRFFNVDHRLNPFFVLFNVILPAVYAYSPDMIFVKIDAKGLKNERDSSNNAIAWILYLISCSARGRIFTMLEFPDKDESNESKDLLRTILLALSGRMAEFQLSNEIRAESDPQSLKDLGLKISRHFPEICFLD